MSITTRLDFNTKSLADGATKTLRFWVVDVADDDTETGITGQKGKVSLEIIHPSGKAIIPGAVLKDNLDGSYEVNRTFTEKGTKQDVKFIYSDADGIRTNSVFFSVDAA